MPSTAGPGTIAMIISSASTVRDGTTFPDWVVTVAPPLIFALIGIIVGIVAQFRGNYALGRQRRYRGDFRLMGFLLVCMGVQFIINGVLEIIKTYH